MDHELITKEFYNTYGNEFDKIPFDSFLPNLLEKYLSNDNILEIGSGGGALAKWLVERGCTLTCLEPAEKLAESALKKGLNVIIETFQNYQPDQIFDVVLAISSLIHIPNAELPLQIERIAKCIKPQGLFIVSFLEGEDEGLEDPTGKGKLRFFSKISQKTLTGLLDPYFSLLEMHRIESKKMQQTFLLIVLKNRLIAKAVQ